METDQPLDYDELADLDPDEQEAYLEQRQADLDAAIAEEQADLAEAEAAALDAIQGGATIPTETVTLGDAEIEVRAEMSGELEEYFRTLTSIDERVENADVVRETCIDAILHTIVDDDEPDADPFDFSSRVVWEEYWREHGTTALISAFNTLTKPALNSMEAVDQFRQER